MSSIIDSQIFNTGLNPLKNNKSQQRQEFLSTFLQKLVVNDLNFYVRQNQKAGFLYKKISLQKEAFMMKLRINLKDSIIATVVYLLEDSVFHIVKSKQNQLLMIKQLLKQDKLIPQYKFCVVNSRFTLITNTKMVSTQKISGIKIVQNLLKKIQENINHFQKAIQQFIKIRRQIPKNNTGDNFSQFKMKLLITQSLSTTNSNYDMSEYNTQFIRGQQNIKKLKDQLQEAQQNIQKATMIQSPAIILFHINAEQFTSDWLKTHLIESYHSYQKIYKKLLKIDKPNEKNIQEFIFNTVKVESITRQQQKPIGISQFSIIQKAGAYLTFISSLDHTVYINNGKQITLKKMLAIKRMRNNHTKIMQKLVHQKSIIEKLRGSCCNFIPKYYGSNQLSNCLLMEYIQGKQLDSYLASKLQTISLWTKIILLLNIVHGIRHLVNYSIVHLDLKPINILVQEGLIVKIIDYGEAFHKDVCKQKQNHYPGFSIPYVSPEIFQRHLNYMREQPFEDQLQFSQKQDVFSFGVIMFQVIFDCKMINMSNKKFEQVHGRKRILDRIFMVGEALQHSGDDNIISTLATLIFKCLDPDPKCRPKFEWICITLKLIFSHYTSNNS